MLILVLDMHAFEKRCGVFNLSLNPHVPPPPWTSPPPPLRSCSQKNEPSFFSEHGTYTLFCKLFNPKKSQFLINFSHTHPLSLLFINFIILLIVLVHGCNVDTGFSSTMTTCYCAHEAMFPASAPCG